MCINYCSSGTLYTVYCICICHVVRWSLLLKSLCYAIRHVPGSVNVVTDALNRTPVQSYHSLHAMLGRVRTVKAIDDVMTEEAHGIYLTAPQRHSGPSWLHAVLRCVQTKGVTRDCARCIAPCAECQKYWLSGQSVVSIPSPISSFRMFEELGIDFISPLP